MKKNKIVVGAVKKPASEELIRTFRVFDRQETEIRNQLEKGSLTTENIQALIEHRQSFPTELQSPILDETEDTVIVPARETPFVPRKWWKVNTTEEARVMISYVDERLTKDKTIYKPRGETVLYRRQLGIDYLPELIKRARPTVDISPDEIFGLLLHQAYPSPCEEENPVFQVLQGKRNYFPKVKLGTAPCSVDIEWFNGGWNIGVGEYKTLGSAGDFIDAVGGYVFLKDPES